MGSDDPVRMLIVHVSSIKRKGYQVALTTTINLSLLHVRTSTYLISYQDGVNQRAPNSDSARILFCLLYKVSSSFNYKYLQLQSASYVTATPGILGAGKTHSARTLIVYLLSNERKRMSSSFNHK